MSVLKQIELFLKLSLLKYLTLLIDFLPTQHVILWLDISMIIIEFLNYIQWWYHQKEPKIFIFQSKNINIW